MLEENARSTREEKEGLYNIHRLGRNFTATYIKETNKKTTPGALALNRANQPSNVSICITRRSWRSHNGTVFHDASPVKIVSFVTTWLKRSEGKKRRRVDE